MGVLGCGCRDLGLGTNNDNVRHNSTILEIIVIIVVMRMGYGV